MIRFLRLIAESLLAASALWAFVEYRLYREDARVLQSLELLERFQVGAIGDAQRAITSTLRESEPAIADLAGAGLSTEAADEARAQLSDFIIYDSNEGRGVWRELDVMFLFLDQVAICVERKLCDGPLVDDFFADYGKTLFGNFPAYIESKREFAPEYALRAEAFFSSGR